MSLVTFSHPKGEDSSPAASEIDRTITDKLHSIDGFFTENAGQVPNEQVRFYSSGGMQAGFAESAVLLKLIERDRAPSLNAFEDGTRGPPIQRDDIPSSRGVMVRITFPGSNKVMPQGVQEMPHRSNYLIGNDPSKWRTGVRSYRQIVYRDLYDGIDLTYSTQGGRLKYEFLVGQGVDPAVITVSYEGAESLRIDRSGELVVSTTLGEMRDGNPIAYQDGKEMDCVFVNRGSLSFGFGCENRDASRNLVIDPLIYSTFIGGTGIETGFSMAVDSSGGAYVTGWTSSPDFPVMPGKFDMTFNGSEDAFVAKLDATGSALVYATYIGGNAADLGCDIAVDSSGRAYVTGGTFSTDFPVTPGAFGKTLDGSEDAFVTELNAAGSALVYSTYLGGSDTEEAWDVALDSFGAAYVTGATRSADYPVTPGSFDTTYNGGAGDAFISKLDATGSTLVYSTFLGGGNYDVGHGISVDSSGNVFLTGSTTSADFQVTPGSFDAAFNGGVGDAFVAKLDATGSTLLYSTFLGGNDNDWGLGVVPDSSGNAYLTGTTMSPNFPTTPGSFDTTYNGGVGDAFVAKLDATGSTLVFNTFMGGGELDEADGITIDSLGNAYVAGETCSADFPTTPGSFDTVLGGDEDAFVAKLDKAGNSLVYGTYLGGKDADAGQAIAVDSSGSVYVSGGTLSADFPVTPGAFDVSYNGGPDTVDVFVTKLNANNDIPPVAEAGADLSARVGESVILNGSGSYDPDLSGSWSEMAPMPSARRGMGLAVVGDHLYAIGGALYYPLADNDVYDVANNTWSSATPMPTARDLVAAVALGDRIYVIGGFMNLSYVNVNEEYNLTTRTWASRAPAPHPLSYYGLGVVQGKIYAVAGAGTFEYDPESDSWATLTTIPGPLGEMAVTSMDDKIYAFGGEDGGKFTPSAYVYDPPSDTWARLPNMTTSRVEAGAVTLAGRLFVLGGETGFGNAKVTGANEMYDPVSGTWTVKTPMPTLRDELAVAAVGDAFYAIGGAGVNWNPVFDENERYSTALAFDWDFGDGSAHSHEKIAAHSYSFSGTYTVTLRVMDAEGAVGTDTLSVTVTNTNLPPVADAGGPYQAFEGATITFDARGSYDPDNGPANPVYRWDFQNDGTWDTQWSQSPMATCTWGDDYSGVAVLQVSDGDLNDTDTATVTVFNVLPSGSVSISTPQQNEGSPITFSAHVTDPGSDDIFLTWKWGFGAPDDHSTYYNNGVSPDPYPSTDIHPRDVTDVKTHTYGDNGAFTVTVFVQDDDSGSNGTTLTITATPDNLPPSVSVSGGMSIDEGQSVSLTATATDPGSDDLKFGWSWGEGSSESRSYYNNGVSPDPPNSPWGTYPFAAKDTATHPYGDNGLYSINLTVTDDDGGAVTWSGQLAVINLPPVIQPFGPFTVNEGSPLLLGTNATDPGSDDLTFTWSFELGPTISGIHYNNGVSPDPPQSPGGVYPFTALDNVTCTYGDNGVYVLTLTVTDDDGGSTTFTTNITVLNLPPVIRPFGPFTVDEGSLLSLATNASDPGSDDLTFSWTFELGPTFDNIHYNNGVSPDPPQSPGGTYPFTASDSAEHTYGDNGVYVVTLTVTDDDGGSASYSTEVNVTNLPPSIAPFGPFEVNEADPLSVTANATDPGSDDLTFTWTFEYGPTMQNVHYNDGIGPDPPKSPDGVFPFSAADTASHTYGDNGVFNITLTVQDDDGGVATYETFVTVFNVAPVIGDVQAYVTANFTLRAAGEKWHEVCMDLMHNGNTESQACVVRYPGSPDDQSKTVTGRIHLLGDFKVVLYYTPDDDPVNGQPNGANPAWVTIAFPDGLEVRLRHTFNVQHNDTWVWTIDDFSAYLVGQSITFNATASDVGSDDLTFEWDWGDGTPATATTHYNDGIGPDPYPSPGGTFPFTAKDTSVHAYAMAGTYTMTLRVTDDDGGVTETTPVIAIPA